MIISKTTSKIAIYLLNAIVIFMSIKKIPAYGIFLLHDFTVVWPWEHLIEKNAFAYIHFWHYSTFWIVPITSGMYFIVLHIYLSMAAWITVKTIQNKQKQIYLLYSALLLVGTSGTLKILIGE